MYDVYNLLLCNSVTHEQTIFEQFVYLQFSFD